MVIQMLHIHLQKWGGTIKVVYTTYCVHYHRYMILKHMT